MYDTAENPTPMLHQEPDHRSISMLAGTMLIFLALLVVFGSGALILYTTNVHPAELNVQATTVVNTILTKQAQATAMNSPQLLYNQLTRKLPSIDTSLSGPGEGWIIGKRQNSSCAFTDGAYHIRIGGKQTIFLCKEQGNNVSDFVFQVRMTILHGSISGMLFRGADQELAGYMFGITSNGLYTMAVLTGNMTNNKTFAFGRSTAIFSGLNQSNLLTVIAHGKYLSFYINKQFINSIDDSTFGTGIISFFATHSQYDADTDVAFNDAQLWIL